MFAGNVQTGAPELLKGVIPRIAAGEKVEPPPPFAAAVATTAGELARYQGDFLLGNGTRLRFRVRDGTLYANEWMMVPVGAGEFFSPRDYGRVKAVWGTDGRLERYDWATGGQVWPAPRVEPSQIP